MLPRECQPCFLEADSYALDFMWDVALRLFVRGFFSLLVSSGKR